MKLPLFKKKISISGIVKVVLALAFAAIASLIIIPAIDYQDWFPQQLGTYDFTPSIDFNDHLKITVDVSGSDYEEWEMRGMMSMVHTRMNRAGISESHLSYTPGGSMTIRIPERYDEQIAYALTAKGEISFQSPKPDVNFEEDPMLLFDPDSFTRSDLEYSDITSAAISQVTDQFTYIEVDLKEEAKERWADYSLQNPSGNFGLTIDGMLYQSWLMPANPDQNIKPNIIITEREPKSLIVFSYLADGPLPTETFYPDVETETPEYGETEITRLALGILGIVAAGLFLRFIIFKEKIIQVIAIGCIIAGAIAITKIVSLPLSIALFLGIAIIMMLLLLSSSRYHLGLLVMLGVTAIPLMLCKSTDLQVIGSLFLTFSGFGLISLFFLIFFDAYTD